jgi:hypothetical protein
MVLTEQEAQFLCRNTLKKEAEDWISASLSVKGLEGEIDLSELRRNSKFWEGVATRGNDIEESLWDKWQSNISFDTELSTAASGLAANRATIPMSPTGESISKLELEFQERLHDDEEEAYQRIIKTDDTAIIIKTDDKAISHVNISHFRVPDVPPPPPSRLLLPPRPLPPVPASSPPPPSSALLLPDLSAALRPLPTPPPVSCPPPPPAFLSVPSTRNNALSNIDTDSVRHLLATTNHAILSGYSINALPNVFASQTSGISPRKTAPGHSLVTGGNPPVDPQGPSSPTDVGPVFYIDDRGYSMIIM